MGSPLPVRILEVGAVVDNLERDLCLAKRHTGHVKAPQVAVREPPCRPPVVKQWPFQHRFAPAKAPIAMAYSPCPV